MKKLIPILLLLVMGISVSAQQGKEDKLKDLEGKLVNDQTGKLTATLKSAARLFGAKDDLTSVIMVIPAGTSVDILDSADSTYYKVEYDENQGYILKKQATIDKISFREPVSENVSASVDRQQPAERQEVATNDRQSRFSYLEAKYGTPMAARLNAGKIWKGMTAEMVKDSWGSPHKINRVINGNTVNEDWTYRSTRLFFRDNKLVDWGPANK
ncbi:MAG TPA: hypothetical protein VHO68_00850 [Bacteroidales bacterium]|nr:hypothetical protein [Bacteroidales bacterium]